MRPYLSGSGVRSVTVPLEARKELSKLQAEGLMVHDRISVTAETMIEVKVMEEQRLLNLPVKQNGGWPTP